MTALYRDLSFAEKVVCNTVGKAFALAAEQLSCYEVSFCKAWLTSETCRAIASFDETIACQSGTYLLNTFKSNADIPIHQGYRMDEKVMFWIGYTLTYWMYMSGIDGTEIAERYDLAEILSQYEVLHTMSVKAAIKTIEKDYSVGKVLLDSVLHPNKEL